MGSACRVMLLGSNVNVLSNFCFRELKKKAIYCSPECFIFSHFLLDVLLFSFFVMAIGSSVSNCPCVVAHPRLNL